MEPRDGAVGCNQLVGMKMMSARWIILGLDDPAISKNAVQDGWVGVSGKKRCGARNSAYGPSRCGLESSDIAAYHFTAIHCRSRERVATAV